jgi:hypothetical protein
MEEQRTPRTWLLLCAERDADDRCPPHPVAVAPVDALALAARGGIRLVRLETGNAEVECGMWSDRRAGHGDRGPSEPRLVDGRVDVPAPFRAVLKSLGLDEPL